MAQENNIELIELRAENEILLKKIKLLQSEKENAINYALNRVKEVEEEETSTSLNKAKQLESLMINWNNLIKSLFEKYPFIKNISSFCEKIEKFNKEVQKIIKLNLDGKRMVTVMGAQNDPMRALLSKVSFLKKDEKNSTYKEEKTYKFKDDRRQAIINSMISEETGDRKNKIKPIFNIQINENEKYDSLVDKFLETPISESLEIQLKPKKNLGDNGFDLKEAVNPKDDLEEIMKAFDFFDGEF